MSIYLRKINQRKKYKLKRLSSEKIALLEELGFEWDPIDLVWSNKFKELIEYKELHGNCDVPRHYSANKPLATWVNSQRAYYRSERLSPSRIASLEEIGFSWDPHESFWGFMFDQLIIFKKEYNHCNVPHGFPTNVALGNWVLRQRQLFSKGNLNSEKLQMLKEVGFDFNPTETHKEKMFSLLTEYFHTHGHTNVPNRKGRIYLNTLQYQELAVWISNIRLNYRRGRLNKDTVDRLNKLNFIWNPTKGWDHFYQSLKHFRSVYGHCDVVKAYPLEPTLHIWVSRQRQDKRKGMLTPEREALLVALGIDLLPSYRKTPWEDRFSELQSFKLSKGHCRVPIGYPSNPELGRWVDKQRQKYKKGTLSPDKLALLDSVGFTWSPRGDL